MKCSTRSTSGNSCCRRSLRDVSWKDKSHSRKSKREGDGMRERERGRESHEEVCTTRRKKFVNYDSDHYEHYNAHYDRPIEQSKHLHFLLPGLAGLTKAPSQTNKPNEKKKRRKANKELTLGNISFYFQFIFNFSCGWGFIARISKLMARQLVCRGPEPVPERAKPSRTKLESRLQVGPVPFQAKPCGSHGKQLAFN